MRILLLTPLYPPAIGGAATYFADIVPWLEADPLIERIVLVTEQVEGESDHITEGKLTILRALPRRVAEKRPYLIHALTYWQTQLWFQQKLAKLVNAYQIDLVHFHTRFRGKLFYQTLAKLPVPILADLRDKMNNPADLAKYSQHLLCCSLGVRQFAIEGGYPESRLTHIPVTFAPPVLPSKQTTASMLAELGLGDRPYLLYLGDITPNKGVYELLYAFSEWQKVVPNAALILAGVNREGQTFINRINQMNGVWFLGHVSHPQALALMQAAALVLLPSRSEALGSVILEAVWLGKKVLCPPNVPEFNTHLPEFVLPEVSAEAIVHMLHKIWEMPASPRYPLEVHNAQGIVQEIVSVYQKLIQKD